MVICMLLCSKGSLEYGKNIKLYNERIGKCF